MTLYLNLATRQITGIAPSSQQVGSLTIIIPTTVDILSAVVESVRHLTATDGYVSITIA
jgi:hypothetical protein